MELATPANSIPSFADRLGRVVVQSQKMDLVPQWDLERANLPTAVSWARKARTQPQNFQSFRHDVIGNPRRACSSMAFAPAILKAISAQFSSGNRSRSLEGLLIFDW
jgi:hypothetical protein